MATLHKEIPIYAYYFPNWHSDPRNEKWHGKGWTEWEVLKCARPHFPDHHQPKIPLWGYEDESDPAVMAKKISAAQQHSIDGFIFCWYWFSDGPYRNKCLEEGFLKSSNSDDFEFSIMWANHQPIYCHPGSRLYPRPPLLDGSVLPETFITATDYCIAKYFNRPNYTRVDDGLYFCIFLFDDLVKSLGGEESAKEILNDFRRRVENAGLGKLHLNVNINTWFSRESFELAKRLGIDSYGSYNWVFNNDEFPFCDYEKMESINSKAYLTLTENSEDKPYNPNVAMGWDVSPRAVQSEIYENVGYPFTNIMYATPEQYENALRSLYSFIKSDAFTGKMLTLNAWNEWTEGSYLEPDKEHGMRYLEAIKSVFGEE